MENEAGGDEPAISAGTYILLNSFEGKGDWAIVPEGFDKTLGPLAEGLDVRLGDAGGRTRLQGQHSTACVALKSCWPGPRPAAALPDPRPLPLASNPQSRASSMARMA